MGPQRPDEHVFTTSNLIHVLTHGNGASSVLGTFFLFLRHTTLFLVHQVPFQKGSTLKGTIFYAVYMVGNTHLTE